MKIIVAHKFLNYCLLYKLFFHIDLILIIIFIIGLTNKINIIQINNGKDFTYYNN